MPNAEVRKCGIPERHRRWRQLILFEPRNGCKVTKLGQSISQPGNGGLWQMGAGRDLLIAQKPVVGMECAQHIKSAGKRDDEAAICRHFLPWTLHLPASARSSLTRGVLQNNPPCQDVELNFAVRNQQKGVATQRKSSSQRPETNRRNARTSI